MRRRGFTLIEVIAALVLLMIVVTALATVTGRFVRTVSQTELHVAAVQLAQDRIQMIQMDPNYSGLDTAYVGVESNFPTLTGFTRETQITQVGGSGQPNDYKRVTVIISGPGLPQPVERTTTVAAP